ISIADRALPERDDPRRHAGLIRLKPVSLHHRAVPSLAIGRTIIIAPGILVPGMTAPLATIEQQTFEGLRPYLFAIAYRMLGSASEAEDVVQDAYLRLLDANPTAIGSLKAYLAAVVTRLCLDELKSARRKRERAEYPGNWLPEPVPTADLAPSPEQTVERREAVSLAMLTLLERLTPEQRAVYVLREAFDVDYAEIAPILGKSTAATRQLGHRARERVQEGQPRYAASPTDHRRLTERFLTALETGNLQSLTETLAADVTFWGDGGRKVQARRRPIHGRVEVLRFLGALLKLAPADIRATVEEINGAPAMVFWLSDGILNLIALDVHDGAVVGIRNLVNPDKLTYLQRRLGPLGSEPASWLPPSRTSA
ncbi:MAG: RNA polymerase sigma-70 factor, partial [Thermomicrobiales bacterium]